MSTTTVERVGVLTGRAIVSILLFLTSLAWFAALFNPTAGAYTRALTLSGLAGVCLVLAWVIHRGEH